MNKETKNYIATNIALAVAYLTVIVMGSFVFVMTLYSSPYRVEKPIQDTIVLLVILILPPYAILGFSSLVFKKHEMTKNVTKKLKIGIYLFIPYTYNNCIIYNVHIK